VKLTTHFHLVLGLRMCGILPSLLHIFQVWCSGIETTSSFKLATDGMTTDISHHHIQHPIQWLMESSFPPEEEQPNHETYHFYPLGAKMCNACRFTSHMTSYVRHRGNFTSTIGKNIVLKFTSQSPPQHHTTSQRRRPRLESSPP